MNPKCIGILYHLQQMYISHFQAACSWATSGGDHLKFVIKREVHTNLFIIISGFLMPAILVQIVKKQMNFPTGIEIGVMGLKKNPLNRQVLCVSSSFSFIYVLPSWCVNAFKRSFFSRSFYSIDEKIHILIGCPSQIVPTFGTLFFQSPKQYIIQPQKFKDVQYLWVVLDFAGEIAGKIYFVILKLLLTRV